MTPTTTAAPRLTEDGAAAFRLLLASAHPDDLTEADTLGLINRHSAPKAESSAEDAA